MNGEAMRAPGAFALGTVQWGLPYGIANSTGQPALSELEKILRRATEAGITTLDTARAYGSSEAAIGKLLRGDRSFRIVTKLTPTVDESPQSAELALNQTKQSLEQSCAALQRDTLDTVLLHRAHHRTIHQGAVWRYLIEQKRSGRINKLGISAASPDQATAALADPSVDVIQVAASLLDRRLSKAGFFARAVQQQREVFIRSIYLQGVAFLDSQRLPAHLTALRPILETLQHVAQSRKQSLAELFLGYARTLAGTLVIGCETLTQFEDNIRLHNSPSLEPSALRQIDSSVSDLPDTILDPSRWPPAPTSAP